MSMREHDEGGGMWLIRAAHMPLGRATRKAY